jgi:Fructose-1-6-bisphosphatase, N-terminal domain
MRCSYYCSRFLNRCSEMSLHSRPRTDQRTGRLYWYVAPVMMQVHLDGGGRYVVVFDPLDGSRNIECSIPTGTIFGVYALPNGHQLGAAISPCTPLDHDQQARSPAQRYDAPSDVEPIVRLQRQHGCAILTALLNGTGQPSVDVVLRRGSEQLASGCDSITHIVCCGVCLRAQGKAACCIPIKLTVICYTGMRCTQAPRCWWPRWGAAAPQASRWTRPLASLWPRTPTSTSRHEVRLVSHCHGRSMRVAVVLK